MIPTGSPFAFRQQIWAPPPLISERVVVDLRAAPWSLDFSGRSARKRARGSGPHHLHLLYLQLCCQKWGSWFSIPLQALLLVEETVSTVCPVFSCPPGEGSTAGLLWALPRGSWFSCAQRAGGAGLISPKFGTSSAEMETPFPLRLSLTVQLIIEVSIKVQISGQNNVKYPAYAFRTVWTLLSEVVGKYWL